MTLRGLTFQNSPSIRAFTWLRPKKEDMGGNKKMYIRKCSKEKRTRCGKEKDILWIMTVLRAWPPYIFAFSEAKKQAKPRGAETQQVKL